MTVQVTADAPEQTPKLTGIVDSDIHPNFTNGLRDFNPYMTETWRRRLGIGGDADWASRLAASSARRSTPSSNDLSRGLRAVPGAQNVRGGGRVHVGDRDMLKLDRDWKALRNDVPWLTRRPSEYLREHVRFTRQPFPERTSASTSPPSSTWCTPRRRSASAGLPPLGLRRPGAG
ncbi:MAG: hypothetical protein ACRDLV_11280 [Solirubrobacteraceae bacterium]